MEKVVVVLGPTASGKTALSIELAKRFDGEIVSADSMQVYKYMDIGTAKPTEQERQGIKHYLVDEVTPDEEFSVAKFQELAYKYIGEIIDRGKLPIVVGGTGLYIDSLLYNINYTETVSDWEFREQMQKEAELKGNEFLHEKLAKIDPEAAARIHPNDLKRIIRALEVYRYTGVPISVHQKASRQTPPRYDYIVIGLTMDRDRLYERINRRVDKMLEEGLLDEVIRLDKMGYTKKSTAMQGLGYKEFLPYLRGETSLEEAVSLLKRDTRHYAKRQLTWFRRNKEIRWFKVDEYPSMDLVVNDVAEYIRSRLMV